MIGSIPRTLIKASLLGLRLPLTTVERVARISNEPGEQWPPAMVFEAFEATAKQVLGGFVRDDELVTEGRLQQAKAAELSRAAQLEIRVAQERAAADERLQRRLARAEADRVQTESETRQRERELQRDKAQEQRRVRESAKRREARLDRTDQVRQRAVETKERSAAKIRVTQGSAALAERRRALSATKKAQDVDRRLATRRAQRKTR